MMGKRLVGSFLIALIVLAASRLDARSIYGQLPFDREVDDHDVIKNKPKQERHRQADILVERAIDYAVELGCRNLNDMILLAKANHDKIDGLEPLDILEDTGPKKAFQFKTPRFG